MYYATPSLFLLWLYLIGKRFTDYSQIILGLQMSIGVFMGMVALGVDPILESERIQGSMCALCTSFVAWTVVNDTVRATGHQGRCRSRNEVHVGHVSAFDETFAMGLCHDPSRPARSGWCVS